MAQRSQRFSRARRREPLDAESGFTLIELLVVVIVIGILAAIAIPVYIGAQASSKDASVKTDLADIKLAVVGYSLDNTQVTTPPSLDKTTARQLRLCDRAVLLHGTELQDRVDRQSVLHRSHQRQLGAVSRLVQLGDPARRLLSDDHHLVRPASGAGFRIRGQPMSSFLPTPALGS